MVIAELALGALALVGLGYWLLIATEGTYLGEGIVTLLYDWAASRYDRIKNVEAFYETRYLGLPLLVALEPITTPRVLDVATGTGRLPFALLREEAFRGTVIGIDRSRQMLAQAPKALAAIPRLALVLEDASALSFADEAFDAVTCLEALEFLPHPNKALGEMLRVLRPGGVLLLSNRVGKDAWLMPFRLCGRGRLERYLAHLGLEGVTMQRWQVHYDLVWAHKPIARTQPPR